MAVSSANLPDEGPSQDDCGRLMKHLRADYIPGLRVEVNFYSLGSAGWGLKMEVIDNSAVGIDGHTYVNIWATKTFGQRVRYVRTADLYDLLMIAYRQIDRYFVDGEAFAPTRRED